MSLTKTAANLTLAGYAVLPVKTDGSKAPAVAWKKYQHASPSLEEVIQWFSGDTDGIGILTGAVSGNVEMVELEGRAVSGGAFEKLMKHAEDNDMIDLFLRVASGYMETTPSGGIHLLYRITDGVALRNTKLARNKDREVLAETRGEGGFVVIAPSGRRTHASGKSWEIDPGCSGILEDITTRERDQIWALMRLLDEEPIREQFTSTTPTTTITGLTAGTRPGDDYNATATWEDILVPHGWSKAFTMGQGHAWTRPGKTFGISATTGQSTDGVDRLYVFTTSTIFESETPYSKFAANALLNHGGDFSATASHLAQQGMGTPATISIDALLPENDAQAATGARATTASSSAGNGTVDAPATHQALNPFQGVANLAYAPAQTLAMSEDGHAQAMINEHGALIRHCSERNRWLHWDGSRWEFQQASGGQIREYAKVIARSYPDEKEWNSHKKRSLSAAGTGAALIQAATDFRIAVSQNQLDARPWELNTPGGIIDLRSGKLAPADPAKLHTKITTATPDFQADPTPWLSFLDTTFQGDFELIEWMQRLLGYACIGVVRENILPVFYGATGANGKTVLLDTVMALLGDYAGPAPKGFLLQSQNKHDTEIADLAGIRMLVSSETNSGERFDEGKVKLLTGGDMLKARFMRQDYFRFTPSHTIFLMSNHRPEVTSGGSAFWRRVREVPFDHEMPEELRDPELKARLVAEHGPAIMAWLAQGAAKYAAGGLTEPPSVKLATNDYTRDTDSVGQFWEEICMASAGAPVLVSRVRSAYEEFCHQVGANPVTPKALTQALAARYRITVSRSNGKRFFQGITLLDGQESHDLGGLL